MLQYDDEEMSEIGGYDLVHHDDLAYVASAHQECKMFFVMTALSYRLLYINSRDFHKKMTQTPKYVTAEATVAKYSEWTTILQYELSQNVRMCIKHIKDKSTHGYLSFIIPQNLQEMDNCLLDKPCKEWAYATML